MTSMLRNVYIAKLDDIVNKYNNTYHRTIKMKPVDVKWSMYVDFNKESDKECPVFKVGDNVRITKYKILFPKGYVPNWSEEIFLIKKVKNTAPWTYVISNGNGEKIVGTFAKKNYKKEIEKYLKLKK